MVRINLRSWREERDEQLQKNFFTGLFLAVIVALLAVFAAGEYYNEQIQRQAVRSSFLSTEINQLKNKLKEIESLKKLKEKRLARLQTIKKLQGDRPLIVRYFDELVRVLPDELHYTSLTRSGDILTINGLASRNQNVSTLMRNLNASLWFGEPNLTTVGSQQLSRSFNLNVQLSKGPKVD
ncbi:pilus assembly protein PilN ['Osedax' symbiont bacterium Rs2_46_30_T18]|nr:pilus assembly protein PilN ['Osedax' symbiont bacterium Rs2_46_30_T18]